MDHQYYLATPGGKSFEAIMQWQRMMRDAMAATEALCKELGAGMEIMHRGSRIDALRFEKSPGAAWRSVRGCRGVYKPHKGTKAGKEIAKRIEAIKIPDGRAFARLINAPEIIWDNLHWGTVSFQKHGDKFIVSVPVGRPDPPFVPPDTTPLKMSEYWAIKEANPPGPPDPPRPANHHPVA